MDPAKELGSCLGRMDSTSESLHLKLYVERLELEIEKVRESLSAKKTDRKMSGSDGRHFFDRHFDLRRRHEYQFNL